MPSWACLGPCGTLAGFAPSCSAYLWMSGSCRAPRLRGTRVPQVVGSTLQCHLLLSAWCAARTCIVTCIRWHGKPLFTIPLARHTMAPDVRDVLCRCRISRWCTPASSTRHCVPARWLFCDLACRLSAASWPDACAGRDGLPVSEVCRLLGLSAKRYDKRLKFFQQHLGIVEVEQQVCCAADALHAAVAVS